MTHPDEAGRFAAIRQLERAGRSAEAEAAYRAILNAHPNHPEALRGLGNLACSANQPRAAEEYFQRAIAARPDAVSPHVALAARCGFRRLFPGGAARAPVGHGAISPRQRAQPDGAA